MTFKACVKLSLYAYGIDAIINSQILNRSQELLVHLESLENVRKPEIDTLNKNRGDIF